MVKCYELNLATFFFLLLCFITANFIFLWPTISTSRTPLQKQDRAWLNKAFRSNLINEFIGAWMTRFILSADI
ncbi:hypothetical protein AB4K20DRAFT_1097190 [Rhizopus microsporus]